MNMPGAGVKPRKEGRKAACWSERVDGRKHEERDAEKAGELWKRHLQKAEEFVLSGSELSTVVDLLE